MNYSEPLLSLLNKMYLAPLVENLWELDNLSPVHGDILNRDNVHSPLSTKQGQGRKFDQQGSTREE